MINIILADDHQLVRQGIRLLLEKQMDFNILAEADNGLKVLPLVEKFAPDVLIVDLGMPGLNGLEVTKQVTQRFSRTQVVVLSMHNDETYVLQALTNGARGYILKESSLSDLIQGVITVAGGSYYLSSPLSNKAIESYLEKADNLGIHPFDTLTAREREVFQLVAEGMTSFEIGEKLVISPRTVEVHRANLMKKLNLKTHTELVYYALRHGVIPPCTDVLYV